MGTATKKEAYPWKAGTSSRHTTNLKQFILRLSISMATTLRIMAHMEMTLFQITRERIVKAQGS